MTILIPNILLYDRPRNNKKLCPPLRVWPLRLLQRVSPQTKTKQILTIRTPQHCPISIASKITAQFPPSLLSLLPAQDSFSTDPCPGDTLSGTNSHHGLIGPPTVRIALIRRRQITRSIRERKCNPLQRVILLSASRPGSDRAWRIWRRGREVNTARSASTSRAFADTRALAGLESVESVDGGAEGGD
jgi:predicted component of type VI protein secretion system